MKTKEKVTSRNVKKVNKELERIIINCMQLKLPYEAAVANVVKYLKEIPSDQFYEMSAYGAIKGISEAICPKDQSHEQEKG